MATLVVEKVSKNFGGLRALDNISFSVESGDRLALIGPNGAGKTSLFNLISGISRPSRGRIFLFGRDVTKASPHQIAGLGVGRTFQITSLFPALTVQENMLLSIESLDRTKFSLFRPINSYKHLFTLSQSILEEWGMQDKQDTLVRNLSYGEQRQLEIALALSQNPKLLLLDEPTSGLSPAETTAVTSMIQTLPKDITILIVEHDMDVVFKVAERFIVLHLGMILATGSPDEIRGNKRVQEIYMGVWQ